jgi:hypothetical protein
MKNHNKLSEAYDDYWIDVEPKIYPTPFLHELMVSE